MTLKQRILISYTKSTFFAWWVAQEVKFEWSRWSDLKLNYDLDRRQNLYVTTVAFSVSVSRNIDCAGPVELYYHLYL
jgi:hypothetical protein